MLCNIMSILTITATNNFITTMYRTSSNSSLIGLTNSIVNTLDMIGMLLVISLNIIYITISSSIVRIVSSIRLVVLLLVLY